VLILELFPRGECVVVLAVVKADALRVAAPALTPAAGGEVERRRGTASAAPVGAGSVGVCLVEDLFPEPVACVEDLDADEPAALPVECDEPERLTTIAF
jgi:hypothetical protein